MLEARIFDYDLEKAREILLQHKAVFKGEYEVLDTIYLPKDTNHTIGQTFLRLRVVPKNIWDEKPVIVAIKNTELKEVGKQSTIPLKKEFNTKEEAEIFIEKNHMDIFEYDFEFSRVGWQYFIGEDGVDLEKGEGYSSIEFKSKTEDGLKQLLHIFDAKDPIKGPSVLKIKEILNKHG